MLCLFYVLIWEARNTGIKSLQLLKCYISWKWNRFAEIKPRLRRLCSLREKWENYKKFTRAETAFQLWYRRSVWILNSKQWWQRKTIERHFTKDSHGDSIFTDGRKKGREKSEWEIEGKILRTKWSPLDINSALII